MEWSETGAQMRIPWGHRTCRRREIRAPTPRLCCVCTQVYMCDLSPTLIAKKAWIFKASARNTKLHVPCRPGSSQVCRYQVLKECAGGLALLAWKHNRLSLDSLRPCSCLNLCLNVPFILALPWSIHSLHSVRWQHCPTPGSKKGFCDATPFPSLTSLNAPQGLSSQTFFHYSYFLCQVFSSQLDRC